ncbi:hypothetical protein AN958_02931, partial [Leucoagaricus sp. SymC.cos]
SQYVPQFASIAAVLYPLTSKKYDVKFSEWTARHIATFERIKKIMTSQKCLTTIDHDNSGNNQIFIIYNTSNISTGAVLSYGKT